MDLRHTIHALARVLPVLPLPPTRQLARHMLGVKIVEDKNYAIHAAIAALADEVIAQIHLGRFTQYVVPELGDPYQYLPHMLWDDGHVACLITQHYDVDVRRMSWTLTVYGL